jgi:tetratricopeptide (TPR) repeat protein
MVERLDGSPQAVSHLQQGRYRPSAGHFQESLALYRELGDRSNEAHALADLGLVAGRLGRYLQVDGYLQQALALFSEIGDRVSTEAWQDPVTSRARRREQALSGLLHQLGVTVRLASAGSRSASCCWAIAHSGLRSTPR